MVRQHTPEELAEAERVLKEATPLFEQRKIREQAEKEKWAKEIAMLERRVHNEFVPVDLGNGDTIALRTCLSEKEEVKLKSLLLKWEKGDEKAAYEIVALVTANELITSDWLRKNPDKFAVSDLLKVLFGMLEQRATHHQETLTRVKNLTTFRTDQAGPESGRVSTLHAGDRSKGMGGSSD